MESVNKPRDLIGRGVFVVRCGGKALSDRFAASSPEGEPREGLIKYYTG